MRSCHNDTSIAYEEYIQTSPEGLHIIEAKRRLNDSKDRDDWEKALNENRESSITSYLSNHPDGKYASKARRWLKSYKKEEDKWSYALKYRTLNAYVSYLSEYPAGRHSKYAKALIEKEHEKDTIKCFSIVGAMVFIIIAYIITCVKLTEGSYYNESYQNEPQQQEVYHQQYTPEEIKSITTLLDKKLKGLEQAKKDGISRNTIILNDAEVLLECLNGTTEYEKYKERLVVVRNN